MVISSRTPEGRPNRCPICGADFRLMPSLPPGDAPCPHCGTLVRFSAAAPRKNIGTKARRVWSLCRSAGRWCRQMIRVSKQLFR